MVHVFIVDATVLSLQASKAVTVPLLGVALLQQDYIQDFPPYTQVLSKKRLSIIMQCPVVIPCQMYQRYREVGVDLGGAINTDSFK